MFFSGEKVCLITGANSGIGKAASFALAKLGCTLIMVSRNHARLERAYRELLDTTGNKKIQYFIADLSSLQDILKLSQKLHEQYAKIDILVNNAGAFFSKRHLTTDGIEATFAVNYLSRFLFTNLVLDLIKKSPQGRIINISGDNHRKGRIEFYDLNMNIYYSPVSAYAQAKLADVLFTYSLAKKVKGTGITVNCMNPGAVASNIIYSNPDAGHLVKLIYKLISPLLRSPEKGAETIVYLASSPEVTNVSGRYFYDKHAILSSPDSYNRELGEILWKESEKLTAKYLNKRLTTEWTE